MHQPAKKAPKDGCHGGNVAIPGTFKLLKAVRWLA
jgi:hypothetical protein